jgi:transposase-like protein
MHMNLLTIFSRFPDQEACIEHLESTRWGEAPYCPLCGSTSVARKADSQRVGRWNCHGCKASFNVLSGTIFEKTKIELQKWFLAIGLLVNAKKSVSSGQLARDLDMNQKSAWYMQQRIRAAMLTHEGELLQGIVEADETYVGGKRRRPNRRDDDNGTGKSAGFTGRGS